jgi:hypothetical protein
MSKAPLMKADETNRLSGDKGKAGYCFAKISNEVLVGSGMIIPIN